MNDGGSFLVCLRDYFAARAPLEPANWFLENWQFEEEQPKEPPGAHFCEGCKGEGQCDESAACLEMQNYCQKRAEWTYKRNRARAADWCYAWADALIERGQGEQTA